MKEANNSNPPQISETWTTRPGPIGLDIGTTNIVVAQKAGEDFQMHVQLNAFYTLPYSRITKEALLRDDLMFFEKDNMLYILGKSADDFANIFGGETRRPIESGILNPRENEGESVIKALLDRLIKPKTGIGGRVVFSVPGEPIGNSGPSIVYHESIVRMHLKSLGYSPVSINEGLAVVLSELAGNNYTGIGISLGGGMCNVCFSYLAIPVMSFSIQKGGDYIDSMVAGSVGESPLKIRRIKEEELDLSIEPRNRIETGLHIYYDDLFTGVITSLQKSLDSSNHIPKQAKALPLVLSGGTILPQGSWRKFQKILRNCRLPFQISEVVVPDQPLCATARGALKMALLEE
jgi:hypothetical protein